MSRLRDGCRQLLVARSHTYCGKVTRRGSRFVAGGPSMVEEPRTVMTVT